MLLAVRQLPVYHSSALPVAARRSRAVPFLSASRHHSPHARWHLFVASLTGRSGIAAVLRAPGATSGGQGTLPCVAVLPHHQCLLTVDIWDADDAVWRVPGTDARCRCSQPVAIGCAVTGSRDHAAPHQDIGTLPALSLRSAPTENSS
jgi:hypothetical protein